MKVKGYLYPQMKKPVGILLKMYFGQRFHTPMKLQKNADFAYPV
jgi:hypothetical protein